MGVKVYKIKYTYSSRDDMLSMKKYIFDNFKYKELCVNYINKLKRAIEGLKILPSGFDTIGLQFRGYDIYLKPYESYLLFYVVDEETRVVTILRVMHDGMNWELALKKWIKNNK